MSTDIKIKLTLSISIGLMLASYAPSALAQQRSPARFNFAPNVYPIEQARIPDGYGQAPPSESHSVRSGHVPSSKDILGLDPGSLPAAPPAIAHTQARLMPTAPAHYQESFGAPNNALAALPKTLTPLSLPKAGEKQVSANKAVSAKLMHAKNNRYIGTKVAGKLLRKNGQSGLALTLKPASYANNFGYEPGPMVPMASGDGMNVRKDVTGKLLHR